jgi:putative flippase GtrA
MNGHLYELVRYGVNGIVATAIHFGVLTFNLEVLVIPSAGVANLLAAVAGISASFLGSRYFVFPNTEQAFVSQAVKFSGLYSTIALFHGATLLIWTDWFDFDYKVGFLIATAIQVSLSYVGNKFLVFRA